MVVKPGPAMVSLTVKRATGTVVTEAMLLKIAEGDTYPSCNRGLRRPLKVNRVVLMWVLFNLDVIHEPAVLSKRCCLDTKESLHVPARAGYQPDKSFGSHNISAGNTNIIRVTAK